MAFSARGVNGAVASSPVGSQEGRTSSFAWWQGTSPHSVHSYPHRQTSQTQNLPNRNQLASISIPSGAKAPFPRIGMPTLRPAMAPRSICNTCCRVRVSLQHRHSQKTPLQDRQQAYRSPKSLLSHAQNHSASANWIPISMPVQWTPSNDICGDIPKPGCTDSMTDERKP